MRIAIFCGASLGSSESFTLHAQVLGSYLAAQNIEVVYGGGDVGLMGVVADATLAAGGRVTGVIPTFLAEKEIAHTGLSELHVVPDMHSRKAKMADLSDAFIAMPGGIGTLEEFFEVWTWAQLGYHQKPCALFNVEGYFDKLLDFIAHMSASNFVKPEYKDMVLVASEVEELIESIRNYVPPRLRWS